MFLGHLTKLLDKHPTIFKSCARSLESTAWRGFNL